MISANRRKLAIFFLIFGIALITLAVALNVGWIFLSLEQIALLVFGIIFFAFIITGLVLNTIFLFREIRRNEQHDAFINAVTHELKTPIASIRLYLETLKTRDISDDKRLEFYDVMLTDADRLLNTVEQVLQAGRTREKDRGRRVSNVDLNNLLEESIQIVKTRNKLEDTAIKFNVAGDEPMISGDRMELQTVFTNILDNAVKYSPATPRISVRAKNLSAKKVQVFIKDNGIGIDPGELKRIFKRFYRVSNLSTQEKKGTGLGLFIVQSIVKKHGGKVWADSRGEDKGSTFIIELLKTR